MKKAETLSEIRVGQVIYDDEEGKKRYVVKSLENKLVPYVIATDNSCHTLYKGVWIREN